jgi:hypothetical protein
MHALTGIAIPAEDAAPSASGSRHRFGAFAALTLVLWGINFGVTWLANVLSNAPNLTLLLGLRLGLDLLGLLLCFAMYQLQWALGRSFRARVTLIAILAPLAAALCAWGAHTLATYAAPGFEPRLPSAELVRLIARWSWFFLGWAGLSLALEYYFDARDKELRALAFENLAQQAQLRALYNQISPHFLFNGLNSISALIGGGRAAEADRIIESLAGYLRATLSIDATRDIELGAEIALHREYLAIEHARYMNLTIDVDVPAELGRALVPALVLQPLIENAIKHGVARMSAPAHIVLQARRDGDVLALRVENTRAPNAAAPLGAGIGLENVRQRLCARFDTRQNMAVSVIGSLFVVELEMPLAFAS